MLRKLLSRSVHCLSCGSEFQRLKYQPGFQKEHKNPHYPSLVEAQEQSFQELVKNLSPAQQAAIGFKDLNVPIHQQPAKLIKKEFQKRSKQERELLQCRWCIDAMQGRETPVHPADIDVLGEIPSGYQLIHVIDAMDFPMTVCKDIVLKYGSKVQFVINRCDLAVDHANKLSKFKEYVMHEVFNDMKVDAKNVHLISVKKQWNLQKFSECLKDANALVGKTGAGKTALAVALSQSILSNPVWDLPFTTQRSIEYKTRHEFRSKLLLDLPSLPETTNEGAGVYGLIRGKFLRKVVAGTSMLKLGNKYARTAVMAKPGQSMSFGGIVGLELPRAAAGQAMHAWPLIGGLTPMLARKVSTIKKIHELNLSTVDHHDEWTMINRENETALQALEYDLTLPVERKGQGKSLVVRGMGVIQPRLFGSITEPYPVKVYGLPGVEMGVRSELLEWFNR